MASSQAQPAVGIQRGDYRFNASGTILLVSLRLLSLPLQYQILTSSTASDAIHKSPLISSLDLTQLQILMLGINSLAISKQAIWAIFLSKERIALPFAIFGGISSYIFESITSYIFTLGPHNPTWSASFVYLGAAITFLGITTELAAEIQRHSFKADPRNHGKICTKGLWGVARNCNFATEIVYSWGYALAAGGPLYACFYSSIYVSNFVSNAIPSFEAYMKQKYAAQWKVFEREVPWRLCPGIY